MASTETAPRRKDASRGAVKHLTVDERVARGKAARAKVPRSTHAEFEPAPDRADPVWLLQRQAESRVPELVPIRYGRMLVSPFAFYRGGALIMAADLAGTPDSGLRVQACGDAHLSNFGVFARRSAGSSSTSTTSTRRCRARGSGTSSGSRPAWLWRVRTRGSPASSATRSSARRSASIGRRCGSLRTMPNLAVWYAHLDVEERDREDPVAVRQSG